jgi:hypothetical protein
MNFAQIINPATRRVDYQYAERMVRAMDQQRGGAPIAVRTHRESDNPRQPGPDTQTLTKDGKVRGGVRQDGILDAVREAGAAGADMARLRVRTGMKKTVLAPTLWRMVKRGYLVRFGEPKEYRYKLVAKP